MKKIIKNNLRNFLAILLIFSMATSLVWLVLNFSNLQLVEAQAGTETLKPTNHTDAAGGTINPELAYDSTDGTTWAATLYDTDADPSITFHTWQTTVKTYTALVLKYRYHADAAFNDTYAVAYSTDGGSIWTDLISPTSAGASDTTISVNLSPTQDLSLVQVKIYTDRRWGPDNMNIYTRDIWTEGTYEIGVISVGTTGSQTPTMDIPSTDNYVGGAFTFIRNTGSADVTQIIITETGTVNANANLSNVELHYETSATCDHLDPITLPLFGTTASFNTSEEATVSGSMTVSASQICLYVVLDVGSGANPGETLNIQIANASHITVLEGNVTAASWPVDITDFTTLQVGPANWRENLDTPTPGVNKNQNIRLRIEVANTGSEAIYNYRLEYAQKNGTCGSFTEIPVALDLTDQHFVMSTSIYVVDGQSTTDQFPNDEGYSFVTGKIVADPSNSSGDITLSQNDYTEIEFVFQPTDNAFNGQSYCFRVTNVGAALNEYAVYPELQITP